MKRNIRENVDAVYDGLEWLLNTQVKFTKEETVDVCARLRSALKLAEKLDEACKDHIKALRKGKPGDVVGEAFTATLALAPSERLDQKLLKAEKPEIVAEYTKESESERITFSAR